MSYNGWKNYETWNVALWIQNDESLYELARECRRKIAPYEAFRIRIQEFGVQIGYQTPDGVAWNDSSLDIEALDEMMGEL